MGRRKGNNYQSVTELQESNGDMPPELRMAGSRILEDLSNEQENINQIQHLAKQLSRYAKHDASFESRGMNDSDINSVLTAPRLSNGASAPFIQYPKRGNSMIERRVHTKEVQNPYTGDMEVIPFRDVDDSQNRALVTEYGDSRNTYVNEAGQTVSVVDMEGHNLSQEYIAEKIMKLAGRSPVRNNTDVVHAVDFKENGRGIDAESLSEVNNPNSVNVQVLTDVNAAQSGGRRPQDIIKGLIANESVDDPGADINTIVNRLMNRGEMDGGYHMLGKLVKRKRPGGEYEIDELVSPVMRDSDYRQNSQGRGDERFKIVHHPVGARSVDMHQARANLLSTKGEELRNLLQVFPNKGYNQDRARARVYLTPEVGEHYVTDMVAQNPNIAQMFN